MEEIKSEPLIATSAPKDKPATLNTVSGAPDNAQPGNHRQQTMTINRTPTITDKQQDVLNKLDLAPATLEALKTLSAIGASEGIEKLSTCDKLTASLEQIRAKKNMKLFEKLDKIRQDFSGLNHKIAKMEESIYDLREVTSSLVKSLPTDGDQQQQQQQRKQSGTANLNKTANSPDKRRTSAAK